jgi:tetratricopeptide (TPR) repeat protein
LSSLSAAAAVTVAFFVLARLITFWFSPKYPDLGLSWAQRLSVYGGSTCGALFFAFSNTYWSSAVEAEVYGVAMFLMMALIWLTLTWAYHRDEPGSDRYLVVIGYLALLSEGIHPTVFLAMPAIFLLVVFLSPRLRRDWRFWISSVLMFLVTIGVLEFLWAASIWLALMGILIIFRRPALFGIAWTGVVLGTGVIGALSTGEPWPIFIAALIWGFGILHLLRENSAWLLAFALGLVSLLGFSVHLYLPIRARHDAAINENNPDTWAAFRSCIERKQYGNESMFQRALHRRATWSSQFGQHERMGFWGFFDRQYGFNDGYFFPVFILGLAGLYQLIRARGAFGYFLIILLLICSAGLIWYMNFADGSRYNAAIQDAYLEVRDRDYFFTPAFIIFGMAIGMGGAALIRWLSGGSAAWAAAGAVIIALLPLKALLANYTVNDRSSNYIPYDYAYNILISADSNAVLFTNGDNDTFPVWCLQEVYGIRKDVRIANLSLLNTQWYIKQLKNNMGVPISLSDADIDRLVHYRSADGKLKRVQDQMIDEVLSTNAWKVPINFAVTVSGSNRVYMDRPLDRHLMMTGLSYRLVKEEGEGLVDPEISRDRFMSVFKFRGVGDSTVYKDENASRLVANYASGFIITADTLRRAGRIDEAEALVSRAIDILPDEPEAYVYLGQMYAETRNASGLESLLVRVERSHADRNQVEVNVGYSFSRLGDTTRAISTLKGILARNPEYEPAYKMLLRLYYEGGRYDSLQTLMQQWMVFNPNDQQTKEFWGKIRAMSNPSESAATKPPAP